MASIFPVPWLFSGIMAQLSGSCAGFLYYDDNMRLWQTQPRPACNRMSPGPPAPPFQLPRPGISTLCTQLSHILACPHIYGMHAETDMLLITLAWRAAVLELYNGPWRFKVSFQVVHLNLNDATVSSCTAAVVFPINSFERGSWRNYINIIAHCKGFLC